MAKLKPSRHLLADATIQEKKIYSCNDKIILGTWNVKIMNTRKFNIVKGEMKESQLRHQIEMDRDLTLSIITSYCLLLGHQKQTNKQKRNGVAFIIRKCIARTILGYNAISHQIILITLNRQLFAMMIIHIILQPPKKRRS